MVRAPRSVDTGPPSGAAPGVDPVHVLVVAEHALVGDSVRTALAARGLVPAVLPVGRRLAADSCEVGLLLTASAFGSAFGAMVMRACPSLPWLVLAWEQGGPSWDAFYESGATLVASPDASLEAVCGLLHDLAGRSIIRSGATL